MQPEQAIARAHDAQALLDNPLLVAVFEEMRANFIQGWRMSDPADKEERELRFQYMRTIDLVEGKLREYVQAGAITEHNQKMAEQAKNII